MALRLDTAIFGLMTAFHRLVVSERVNAHAMPRQFAITFLL